MTIQVLNALADASDWHDRLSQCPPALQDVYYLPEYVQLFCMAPGVEGFLFVYSEDDKTWMNAVVLSPVIENCFDVETPYGYGGPVSTSSEPQFLAAAREAYLAWLRERGVIAELVRFHPLIQNAEIDDPGMRIDFNRYTLSIIPSQD